MSKNKTFINPISDHSHWWNLVLVGLTAALLQTFWVNIKIKIEQRARPCKW